MLIYVLEDMEARIKWLKEFIGPDHTVLWATSVKDFLALFDNNSSPDCVILDHDLGGIPDTLEGGSVDEDGMTGFDAVDRMPVVTCPILVWSYNSVRAPEMARILKLRGMRAGWAPFKSGECVASLSRIIVSLASKERNEENQDSSNP